MKRTLATLAVLATLLFCGLQNVPAQEGVSMNKEEARQAMQQTYNYLKEAKVYYLATVDQDQPRVRPFGTVHIFEDKLYIQTGRKKNVAKQLLANGKVEICAMKDRSTWIRVSGVLVDDPRREAKVSMLAEYPELQRMYSPDDDNTMVLFFQPGTVEATISSFTAKPIVMKF
jgi:uncharacterized pyridoxamine 5'-phosphate oxidase family protein